MGPPQRASKLEADIAVIKSNVETLVKGQEEMKKGMVWKDTCEERHKGVDATIQTVKRKACRVEEELDEHKKEDKADTKYTVTTIIAIAAILISIGLGIFTYMGG